MTVVLYMYVGVCVHREPNTQLVRGACSSLVVCALSPTLVGTFSLLQLLCFACSHTPLLLLGTRSGDFWEEFPQEAFPTHIHPSPQHTHTHTHTHTNSILLPQTCADNSLVRQRRHGCRDCTHSSLRNSMTLLPATNLHCIPFVYPFTLGQPGRVGVCGPTTDAATRPADQRHLQYRR